MLYSRNEDAALRFGVKLVPTEGRNGLGRGGVATAGNSGHQAVNLAFLLGASPIVLLGFDMAADGPMHHFHGNHTRTALTNPTDRLYRRWRTNLRCLVDEARVEQVRIVNCSRRTALDIPSLTLEDMLCQIRSGSPKA